MRIFLFFILILKKIFFNISSLYIDHLKDLSLQSKTVIKISNKELYKSFSQ
jgi:hypothetical protein